MQNPVACQALFIAAPSSGQGKTTITAALARMLSNQGKRVRVFKAGPDYLDPQVLEQACGSTVEQLDLWMADDSYCRQRLYNAAQDADIILVEGAMGIFDGEPSSADLAVSFGIPLVVVMNVQGMAQTAAALMKGIAEFRTDVNLFGMIANNCASLRHQELIQSALPASIQFLASVKRDPDMALPERHLGLVQAVEITDDLELKFEVGAKALIDAGLGDRFHSLPRVYFSPPSTSISPSLPPLLDGVHISIAKDDAFSFIYQANIDTLTSLGAKISFFSPLTDAELPNCDAVWLPGGYPELHGALLAENASMINSMRNFYSLDKPILAECGGLLYCLESLIDYDGYSHSLLGLIPGRGSMTGKRGCQGMQSAVLPEGEVRGHSHHRSITESMPEPFAYCKRQKHPAPGEAIYRSRRLTASYLHLFFHSNPSAIATLFLP